MLLGIVAVALVAIGVVLWRTSTHPRSVSHGPPAGTDSRKSRSHPHPHPTPAPAGTEDKKASPPKRIHVTLTAARSDSWVEIRQGSAAGRVLFDGVVSEGKSIRVVGRRFWARFGALGNFDVTINGRPVQPAFDGTVDALITASAIRQVTSQSQSG